MATLKQLEEKIEKGLKAYGEMCQAMKEIADGEKWREGDYDSFNSYARDRWSMDIFQASRLIKAAVVVCDLEEAGCTTLPANDGQCRVLGRLKPAQRVSVWKKVCRRSGKPTAKVIETEAKAMGFIQGPAATQEATEPSVADDLGKVLNSLKVIAGRIRKADKPAVERLIAEIAAEYFRIAVELGMVDESVSVQTDAKLAAAIKAVEARAAEKAVPEPAVTPEPPATLPMKKPKTLGIEQPWSDDDETK